MEQNAASASTHASLIIFMNFRQIVAAFGDTVENGNNFAVNGDCSPSVDEALRCVYNIQLLLLAYSWADTGGG